MTTKCVIVPISKDKKSFCEYMGYTLALKENDIYYYKVPANQVCRLYINAENWKKGNFDKSVYLKNINQ